MPDPSDDPAALPPEPTPRAIQLRSASSPVNLFLIIGSVALAVWTNLGQNRERLLPFFISLYPAASPERLLEVRGGEVWRLLTPAFLHFGVAHLGFNMLNMVGLGNILERRIGSGHYLAFAVAIMLSSNLGQYFISGHPGFGGMSGVVYGLFGYVWLRGRTDPTFGLAVPTQTVVIALVWFAACFTGALGPIANSAHAVGLVVGCVWGLAAGRNAMTRAQGRL